MATRKPILIFLTLLLLSLPPSRVLARTVPTSGARVAPLRAVAASATGTVNGIVLDAKRLLAGALVTCTGDNGPVRVHTDPLGDFQIHLAPGRYRCVATMAKHAPSATRTIMVKAKGTLQLTFILKLSSGSTSSGGGFVPTPLPTEAPSGPVGGATCSWTPRSTAKTDTNLHTWSTDLRADPKLLLTITGGYPAARYVSLHAYTLPDGKLLAALPDTRLPASPGSVNPFVAATARGHGTYTLHLVFGPQPRNPAPKTIYAAVGSGTTIRLWYSVYLPDAYAGDDGDAGLPQVTAHFASTGTPSGCPIPGFVVTRPPAFSTPFGRSTAISGTATVTATAAISSTPTVTAQATGTPTPATTATTTPGPTRTATPRPTTAPPPPSTFVRTADAELGGFANPDAADLSATLQPGGGVYVVRFRAPITLGTLYGGAINGSGQVRYWSFCVYGFAGAAQTCRADEQVPVGPGGVVTFVLGAPSAQPPNTVGASNVVWIPLSWSFLPHTVVYHQLVPSRSFTGSIARVPLAAGPAPSMGAYAPTIVHCTTAQFQANRCSG